MQYLQRLVTQFCGVCEPEKEQLRVRRVQSFQEQSHNDLEVKIGEHHGHVSIAQIVEHCKNLSENQKPVSADWIKYNGKKILLLDLDKTLIFSTKNRLVYLRPYLNQFLQKMSQHYDMYLFTAATSQYVMYVTLQMRVQNVPMQLIKGYLTRENCIRVQMRSNRAVYIKDLRILSECPQNQIVIVDDTPLSYCLNPNNALPIAAYEGCESDDHLLKIMERLLEMKDVSSVTDFISGNKVGNGLTNKQKKHTNQKQSKNEDSDSEKQSLGYSGRTSKLTTATSCQSKP